MSTQQVAHSGNIPGWGSPENEAYALLMGAEPDAPSAGPSDVAPGGETGKGIQQAIIEAGEWDDGEWRPGKKVCDVRKTGKSLQVPALVWTAFGEGTEMRDDEWVFSVDKPADGMIATKITVPAGVHVRFNFEAGYYGNRTNAFGTQPAFLVTAVVDGQVVAHAEHKDPTGGPKDLLRPTGFAFICPGSGDVEVELRFHDRTDRNGAARDLRIKPTSVTLVGETSTEVQEWESTNGAYSHKYYATTRWMHYVPDGKIGECKEAKAPCPGNRNAKMCDSWWDVSAKKWREQRIDVHVEFPCEGLYVFTYSLNGEPYELKGQLMVCGTVRPDPRECPKTTYSSCKDITGDGTVTFTRVTHIPCEGEAQIRNEYKGQLYTPANDPKDCEEVETIEEARKREGKTDCPKARFYSCEDVSSNLTVIFTKTVITACDNTEETFRTYGGVEYELKGEEKNCKETKTKREAEEKEDVRDCPTTVTDEVCDRRKVWVTTDEWKFSDGVTGPDADGFFYLGKNTVGGDWMETVTTPENPGGKSWYNFKSLALGASTGKAFARYRIEFRTMDDKVIQTYGPVDLEDGKELYLGYNYSAPAKGDVKVRLIDATSTEDASRGELAGLRTRPNGYEKFGDVKVTRHITTLCDGTVEPARYTLDGKAYTAQGTVDECGKCPMRSEWYSCLDKKAATRYVREDVFDCNNKLLETVNTFYGRTYKPGADVTCEKTSKEEAHRRQGKDDCPNTSKWSNCTEVSSEGTVTYTREEVVDCNGKHVTWNRTYDGKTYTREGGKDWTDWPEISCRNRSSKEEAEKNESKKACPKLEIYRCLDDSSKGEMGGYKTLYTAGNGNWIGGGPKVVQGNCSGYAGDRLRGYIKTSGGIIHLRFDEPVWVEFALTWMTEGEGMRVVDDEGSYVPSDDTSGPFSWDQRRMLATRLRGGHTVYSYFGVKSTKPVTDVIVLGGTKAGTRGDLASGLMRLRVAEAGTGKDAVPFEKRQVVDCNGKVTDGPVYTKDGKPYKVTGKERDCKPLS